MHILKWFLGHALEGLGRFPEAVAVFAHAAEISGGACFYLSALARVSAEAGDSARAGVVLVRLTQNAAASYVSPLDLAIAHPAAGDSGAALDQLDAACEQRVMRSRIGINCESAFRLPQRLAEAPRNKGVVPVWSHP